jgi:hypothetical protein
MILQNSIVEKAIDAHLSPVFFMIGEYMLYDIGDIKTMEMGLGSSKCGCWKAIKCSKR